MSFLFKMASYQTQLHRWENTMKGVKQTFKESGVITTEHLYPSVGLPLCYTDLHRANVLHKDSLEAQQHPTVLYITSNMSECFVSSPSACQP